MFVLSQELSIHSDAARSMALYSDSLLVTGGGDNVLCLTDLSVSPPAVVSETFEHAGTITDICIFNDMIVTACFDSYIRFYIIDENKRLIMRKLIVADTKPISSLNKLGQDFLLSGSWSGSAKIWKIEETDSSLDVLEVSSVTGLENNITVLALSDTRFVAASTGERVENSVMNFKLRMYTFDIASNTITLTKTIEDHKSSIRGLCLDPNSQRFFSCGNDGLVIGYDMEGHKIIELGSGIGSFCYSISLYDAKIYAAYDDLCVRVFDLADMSVSQILHPASLWRALHTDYGLVTGASDSKVRIFSSKKSEQADAEVLAAYEAAVQAQVDVLTAQANKASDEVKRNVEIDGVKFDYAFKVDLTPQDNPADVRILYLGYNIGTNVYVAAEDFCTRNGIPTDQVPSIVQHISSFVDVTETSKPNLDGIFPMASISGFFFDMKDPAVLAKIMSKMDEFDASFSQESNLRFTETEKQQLSTLIEILEDTTSYHSSSIAVSLLAPLTKSIDLWDVQHLFPVFDLCRIAVLRPTASQALVTSKLIPKYIENITKVLLASNEDPKVILTGLKLLANLFRFGPNIEQIIPSLDTIVKALTKVSSLNLSKSACFAAVSVAANLANACGHLTKMRPPVAMELVDVVAKLVPKYPQEKEKQRRVVLCLGCLLVKEQDNMELKMKVRELETIMDTSVVDAGLLKHLSSLLE